MIPEQRRIRILQLLAESGGVTLAAVEKEFGVSAATARRDLAALERRGKIKRTHGGAISPALTQHEDSFQHRMEEAVGSKKRLARAAVSLVEEGQRVFVDSSTTAYYAAREMVGTFSRGTFLTNLVPVMDLFGAAASPDLELIGMGGSFRPLTLSFVGPSTVRMVESYLADTAFFSVWGITPDGQLTDPNPLEAEVKRTMIRQSERPVLVVDGRKFERRALSVIANVSDVSLVLVADARRAHLEAVERFEVDVRSA